MRKCIGSGYRDVELALDLYFFVNNRMTRFDNIAFEYEE